MSADTPASVTIQEIIDIRSRYDRVLSGRRARRLQIWLGLLRGLDPVDIMAETRITRHGLEKLQDRIHAIGWTALILKLRQQLESLLVKRSRPKGEKGRPRTKTLKKELSLEKLGTEPIIALVCVVGGADVQFAVFAVRHRIGEQTGAKALLKVVREACVRPMRAEWSRGYVDDFISAPLKNLKSSFSKLQGLEPRPVAGDLRLDRLAKRFRERWSFLILCSHGCEASQAFQALVEDTSPRPGTVECKGAFVDHLEAAIYTLRVTQNLRGFLPSFQSFQQAAYDYRRRALHQPFHWQATELEILVESQRRARDFLLRATNGYMFDLTGHVRNRIPDGDEFRATSLPVTNEIKLTSSANGIATGEVMTSPEFYILFSLTGTPARRWTASKLREFWDRHPDLSAFDYVVRPEDGHPNRMKFPYAFLSQSDKVKSVPMSTAVISVPRQFLMPPLEIPISEMQRIAKQNEDSDGVGRILLGGEPALVLRIPRLSDAIRAAFIRNKYGDRVHSINQTETWYRKRYWGPVYAIRRQRYGETRYFGVTGDGVQFKLFEPPFYFSQRALSGKVKDSRTQARLLAHSQGPPPRTVPMPAIALPLGPDTQKIIRHLRKAYGKDSPVVQMLAAGVERFEKTPKVNPADLTLRYLYKAFDADFMLRELAARDWKALIETAERWGDTVRREICKSLFPESRTGRVWQRSKNQGLAASFAGVKLDHVGVKLLVPKKLRGLVHNHEASLRAWVFEALGKFEKASRVLRSAVETAQQFVLEGLEPKAIVVRTVSSIMQSWRVYFNRFIRQKLVPEEDRGEPAMEEIPEHLVAPATSFNEDEVSDFCDTISKLAKPDDQPRLLDKFAELAQEMDKDTWVEVFARLEENQTSPHLIAWAKKAIQSFRSPGGELPETLQAVARDLERARRSTRPLGKKR